MELVIYTKAAHFKDLNKAIANKSFDEMYSISENKSVQFGSSNLGNYVQYTLFNNFHSW